MARALVPVDVYEWIHVFECLLRLGRLDALDLRSILYRPPGAAEERWRELARRRMQADFRRATETPMPAELGEIYASLIDDYDRAGLPWERCLARLGYCQWLLAFGRNEEAAAINAVTLDVARRRGMQIMEADALELAGQGRSAFTEYRGPARR